MAILVVVLSVSLTMRTLPTPANTFSLKVTARSAFGDALERLSVGLSEIAVGAIVSIVNGLILHHGTLPGFDFGTCDHARNNLVFSERGLRNLLPAVRTIPR
jgi:hypothetical protein